MYIALYKLYTKLLNVHLNLSHLAIYHMSPCGNGMVKPGFGNQFIFRYEVEVELSIQLENGDEVEYE